MFGTLIDLICVNSKERAVQWELSDTHFRDQSITDCVLKSSVPKTPFVHT